MPRADWKLVSQSEFIVPTSLEEQCRFAEVFEGVDHLITLHQRKPLIVDNKTNFVWEQRKFSDFTWKAGKRNKEDLDLEPYRV